MASGRIAKDDGVGLKLARHVRGEDFIRSRVKIQRNAGASDGKILVVDGELRGSIGLLRKGGRCKRQRKDCQ